jgi:hypothetical protein
MPGLLRLLGTAALAAGVIACGSVRTDTGPDAHVDALIHLPDGPPPKDPCKGAIDLDDFGACVSKALCAKIAACGLGQSGEVDCTNLPIQIFNGLNTRNLAAGVRQAVAAGRLSYDPVAAGACLADLDAGNCKSVLGSDLFGSCSMFVGKVAANNTCGYPVECAAGNACLGNGSNAYSGTCGNDSCRPRVAVNQSCATAACQVGDHCVANICRHGDLAAPCSSDNDCDADFYCAGTTCAAQLAKDKPCTTDRQCAGALACVGRSLSPPAGKCEEVATLGAACDYQCYGPFLCQQSATPTTTLGSCVAEPGEGEPCVTGSGCGLGLLICDDKGTPADPKDDICREPGKVGAPCTKNGDGCNVGLLCTADISMAATGVCRTPLPNNSACFDNDQCASGNCLQQLCQPLLACSL